MPAFVQSASNALHAVTSVPKAFNSPNGAGNLLVAVIGLWHGGGAFVEPTVTDSQGNAWVKLLNTPALFPSGISSSCSYLFVAYNCRAGANTVTVHSTASVDITFSIFEYSGVALVNARDQITAAGNLFSGTVNTGSITTQFPNEVLISFGFDQSHGTETFTPSAGWTQREKIANPNNECLCTFDQIVSSTGVYSNTISVPGSNGMHGLIVSFSDTPNTDLLIQSSSNSSSSASSLSVAFTQANQAGNFLLLGIGLWASTTLGAITSVSDTQGNTWALLGSSPLVSTFGKGQSQAYFYQCASCKAGANSINVATASSEVVSLAALEYLPRQASVTTGFSAASGSVSSGNMPATVGALAVSVAFDQSTDTGIYSDFSVTGWKQRSNVTTPGVTFSDFGTALSVFDQILPAGSVVEQTVSVLPGSSGFHLVLSLSTSFSTEITLTGGNFQDALAKPLANGYLIIYPNQDSAVPAVNSQVFAGRKIRVPLDNNGKVAGTTTLFATDQMVPSGAQYIVKAFSADNVLSWGPHEFSLPSSNSVFDITQWIPTVVGGLN